ncbi:MAG: hypothetical protein ABI186_09780 [Candidatus Elarobacter sp.]
MTLQIPTLLALLGAALLAVAIFAPKSTRAAAPPVAVVVAVDRWATALGPAAEDPPAPEPRRTNEVAPSWPERFDPRAAGCDAAARIALIGALAEVRAGWAESLLRSAFGEETDPHVRGALEDALAQRHSTRDLFETT